MSFCSHCGTQVSDTGDAYCQKCQQPLGQLPIVPQSTNATVLSPDGDIAKLEQRVELLERRLEQSWIVSPVLMKRILITNLYLIVFALLSYLIFIVALIAVKLLLALPWLLANIGGGRFEWGNEGGPLSFLALVRYSWFFA